MDCERAALLAGDAPKAFQEKKSENAFVPLSAREMYFAHQYAMQVLVPMFGKSFTQEGLIQIISTAYQAGMLAGRLKKESL